MTNPAKALVHSSSLLLQQVFVISHPASRTQTHQTAYHHFCYVTLSLVLLLLLSSLLYHVAAAADINDDCIIISIISSSSLVSDHE